MSFSDDQLLANFLKDARNAFRELVGRYHAKLKNYAYWNYLHDEEEAEDAVQQTFLSVFKYAGTFNPARSSFSNWIYTICTNECLRILRGKPNFAPLPEGPEDEQIEIEDKRPPVDITELTPEKSEELRTEYLTNLNDDEKKIIELHLLVGKSYREIQEMKLSEFRDEKGEPLGEDALEKRYNRALIKLREYHRKKKEGG
ncbi:MAG: RNA polymerase sigma factor [Planctomycetes bacterium]|nr:RNA polymerase sigma factor [Planctomycetota bacterium]